ncbi:MAG: zinc ribbon domain-containing protein [Chloroflexota bacterium]
MPLYEYHCRICGATVEIFVRDSQTVTCPHCGGAALDKLISAPAVLSGKTARTPGHTCCGREERCSTPPCSTGGTCRHES